MYAMGPVFGFALSAGLTRIYSTITDPPSNIDINSNEWVGAWWLGYIICGILYLLCAFPLFLFPKTLLSNERDSEYVELQRLRHGGNLNYSIRRHHEVHLRLSRQQEEQESPSAFQRLKNACRGFSFMASELIQNPVFVLAVIAWTFGSYLAGGYTTYLPKYVETQYGRSASIADIYAGIISVGSVAVSTAIGGYLLTRFNFSPRRAALCLMACWSAITITYLLGMLVGCDEPAVNELIMDHNIGRLRFQGISTCNFECHCDAVSEFNPVHYRNTNYYSPCHAGCMQYDEVLRKWSTCYCTPSGSVENGLKLKECNQIYAYVAIMFVGLFCGNLFFMANMMIVLRSVYDEQKVMALSFASCITNVLGRHSAHL
ncbi:hypothetical protein AB6A40_007834 [Gnathostoma spinigerum]|uniref:Solute carrier organic anion transporter family member n=1 Tax=Gnathostoma spinigerum TaxID=75299 RepID=A0ABD6EME4_9BILA